MFIRVDLPAPFSPSSACTSPRARSKLTSSLARTPGNCFTMPRISRTVGASAMREDSMAPHATDKKEGADSRPPPRVPQRPCELSDDERRCHLAVDDELLQRQRLCDDRLRHRRVDLPEVHPAVGEVEVQVAAAER